MSPAVEQLLDSAASEPPAPELTGEALLSELKRRSDEIDSGEAILTSWAEVKKRVRSRLEGRSRG